MLCRNARQKRKMTEGKSIQAWLNTHRICHVCKARYTNAEIGSWNCREHCGMVKNGVFLCCGTPCGGPRTTMTLTEYYATYEYKTGMTQGCIRADHNELSPAGNYRPYCRQDPTKGGGILDMDAHTAQMLNCNEQSIVSIPSSQSTEVSVYRFDKDEYSKRKKHK